MTKPADMEARLRLIAGRQNPRLKELRRLFHDATPNARGEVAVEGFHLVEEAIRSRLKLSTVFFSESALERARKLLPQLASHTETLVLPNDLFAGAVPTETPQGVAALVVIRQWKLSEVLRPEPPLVMIAAGLQDPGNLGTVARSSEAFGATGLLVAERTVSPWNWKALRASAGSLFRLPTLRVELPAALAELKQHGVRVLASSSHKGRSLLESDLRPSIAIIIGSEGGGLSREVLAQCDELATIPHAARVESLNAGIAASVMLYEASRQRQLVQGQPGGQVQKE